MLATYWNDALQKKWPHKKRFTGKTSEKVTFNDYLRKMNRFILMSGSAQRKPLQLNMAEEKIVKAPKSKFNDSRLSHLLPQFYNAKNLQSQGDELCLKTFYEEEFYKLRSPHRRIRSRIKNPDEGVPASKSCKILFDYLKFYNSVSTSGEVGESHKYSKIIGFEKEAEKYKSKKNMQFIGDSMDLTNLNNFLTGYDFVSSIECNKKSENKEFSFLNLTFARETEMIPTDQKVGFNFATDFEHNKTMTSEDFMKNAFSDESEDFFLY